MTGRGQVLLLSLVVGDVPRWSQEVRALILMTIQPEQAGEVQFLLP